MNKNKEQIIWNAVGWSIIALLISGLLVEDWSLMKDSIIAVWSITLLNVLDKEIS